MVDAKKGSLPPPPPHWVLDLNSPPTPKGRTSGLPDPPGYTAASTSFKRGTVPGKQPQNAVRKAPNSDEMDTLKLKKAWEVAIAPAKSLPMSAIGMYMTGNTLQIFSIFMLFTLFKTPLQAIMNLNNTFARYESDGIKSKMLGVKVVFVLTNMLALALGIYKVNQMGLLPTARSDWLAWETQRIPLERAYPDFET